MSSEDRYTELLQENINKKNADIKRKNIIITCFVVYFLFITFMAFDLYGKMETIITLRDAKANELFQRMQNEYSKLDQKHDSLIRLNDSINQKLFVLKMAGKVEY